MPKCTVVGKSFVTKLLDGGVAAVKRYSLCNKVLYRAWEKDFILVEVHKGDFHWTWANINLRDCRFEWNCSLHSEVSHRVMELLSSWLAWLIETEGKRLRIHPTRWSFCDMRETSPRQGGDLHCGVFALFGMTALKFGQRPSFTLRDAAYLRDRLLLECIKIKLLPELRRHVQRGVDEEEPCTDLD